MNNLAPDIYKQAYSSAEQGRNIVLGILNEIEYVQSVLWLILPEDNTELNRICCGVLLDNYLEKKNHDSVVVIQIDSATQVSDLCLQTNKKAFHYSFKEDDMQDLLAYYRLVQFSEDIIVAALKEPYSFPAWIGHFDIDLYYWVEHVLFCGTQINWMWWKLDLERIEDLICANHELLKTKKVYIYGLTHHVKALLQVLKKQEITVTGLLDSDSSKAGYYEQYGLSCYALSDLLIPYDPSKAFIIMSKHARAMITALAKYGYSSDQIIEIPADGGVTAVKGTGKEVLQEEFSKACKGIELRWSISDKHMIIVQYGTGDVFYACSMMRSYIELTGEKELILIIPDNPSCSRIPQLFNIQSWNACSIDEMALLYKAWEFFGADCTNIRPFLNLGSRLPRKLENSQRSNVWNHWLNAIKYQYFSFGDSLKLERPALMAENDICKKYSSLGYPRKKTVLLSPYANSFSSALIEKTDFWQQLAGVLKKEGFVPVTNVSNSEKAIAGTDALFVPYEELPAFLDFAGYLIAIRSGLCDISGLAEDSLLIHIYERGSGIQPEIWSLNKMGININTIDFVYSNDTEELITEIMNLLNNYRKSVI